MLGATQSRQVPASRPLMADSVATKRALRAHLRAARDALTSEERGILSEQARGYLNQCHAWRSARVIAGYLPHQSEFDPSLLIQEARDRNVKVVYPRVEGKNLSFREWQAGDVTETTIGSVLQPAEAAPAVATADIDLFITPLLGCGTSGIRLGYGGGFYDRVFADASGFRLGVGFAIQRVTDWHTEPHDQTLDGFLSEEGLTLFT